MRTSISLHNTHLLGAIYVIISGLLFAIMGVGVKFLFNELPVIEVVFFRNSFGLLLLLFFMVRRLRDLVTTNALKFHLVRALLGLGAMFCFYFAIGHVDLSTAVLLSNTSPIFAPIVAYFWLGEKVPISARLALVIGFLGVFLLLKPGELTFNVAAFTGLLSGVLSALSITVIRYMSSTESPTRIVFYNSVIGVVVSAVPLLWYWVTPTASHFMILSGIAISATLAQLAITRGLALAPIATIGPFSFSTVLFAGIFGWVLWLELPDALSLLGTLLVITGGVIAISARRITK